jgi:hypothetical protein
MGPILKVLAKVKYKTDPILVYDIFNKWFKISLLVVNSKRMELIIIL